MDNEDFYHTDTIIVSFNKESQLLSLHHVYSDGTKDLYTHIHLSKLKEMGTDTACQALGENILIGLPTTRNELFKPRLGENKSEQK